MKLHEILTIKGSDVHSIDPEATLADVVDKLVEMNCGSLLVCEDEQMIGIITERDILRACSTRKVLEETSVRGVMTSNVVTSKPSDDIGTVMGLMTDHRIRHLPVLDDAKLVGMISIGDLVKSQHAQLEVENHYLKNYIQS